VVSGGEVLGGGLGDESLVEEPSNCWALSAGVTERLPHRHQVRGVLAERAPELTERSSAEELGLTAVVQQRR